MNVGNEVVRAVATVIAVALGLRFAWILIQPVLPAIGIAVLLLLLWRVWRWHRDRW